MHLSPLFYTSAPNLIVHVYSHNKRHSILFNSILSLLLFAVFQFSLNSLSLLFLSTNIQHFLYIFFFKYPTQMHISLSLSVVFLILYSIFLAFFPYVVSLPCTVSYFLFFILKSSLLCEPACLIGLSLCCWNM